MPDLSVFKYPPSERKEKIKNRTDEDIVNIDLPFSLNSGKITYFQTVLNLLFANNDEIFNKYTKDILLSIKKDLHKNKYSDTQKAKLVLSVVNKISKGGEGVNIQSAKLVDLLGVMVEGLNYKKNIKTPASWPDNKIYYYFSKHNSSYFKNMYETNKKEEILSFLKQIDKGDVFSKDVLILSLGINREDLLFNNDVLEIYSDYCLDLTKRKCNEILEKCGARNKLSFLIQKKINEKIFGPGMDSAIPYPVAMKLLNNTAKRLPGNATDKHWNVIFKSYKTLLKKDDNLKYDGDYIKTMLDRKELENGIKNKNNIFIKNETQSKPNKKRTI